MHTDTDYQKAELPEAPTQLERLENFVSGMARSKEDGTTEPERRRLYRRLLKNLREVERPRRMTKPGFALQPSGKPFVWRYEMTASERSRRKARRQMQKASRRANRG